MARRHLVSCQACFCNFLDPTWLALLDGQVNVSRSYLTSLNNVATSTCCIALLFSFLKRPVHFNLLQIYLTLSMILLCKQCLLNMLHFHFNLLISIAQCSMNSFVYINPTRFPFVFPKASGWGNQTWNLSKILHTQIFRLKVLHRKSA